MTGNTGTRQRAAYFDSWYENMTASSAHARIQQGALGLPTRIESSSLLPWEGLGDVLAGLELRPGDTLIDAGCGRGGYGLEIADRSRTSLVGIDFSAVAIRRARELAAASFPDVDAQFEVGTLTGTGRPDASVDALMCIDALQFGDPYEAALAELLRVLAPGGRLVVTCWQARDLADETVPGRARRDVPAALRDAGFEQIRSRHMTSWREIERAMWQRAVSIDPAGDPALQSLHDEGVRTLAYLERTHRLLVIAKRIGVAA